MSDRNLIKSLQGLIEAWRHRETFTASADYDIGCENTTEALADELEAVLNKFQESPDPVGDTATPA